MTLELIRLVHAAHPATPRRITMITAIIAAMRHHDVSWKEFEDSWLALMQIVKLEDRVEWVAVHTVVAKS